MQDTVKPLSLCQETDTHETQSCEWVAAWELHWQKTKLCGAETE